jgi:hypothetical protein
MYEQNGRNPLTMYIPADTWPSGSATKRPPTETAAGILGPLGQGVHDHRTSHRCGWLSKEWLKTLLDPR